MKAAGLEKTWMDWDVLAAARERFRILYQRLDTVVVSFSGGNDSTVCLHLALEAASQAGKLPVRARDFGLEGGVSSRGRNVAFTILATISANGLESDGS